MTKLIKSNTMIFLISFFLPVKENICNLSINIILTIFIFLIIFIFSIYQKEKINLEWKKRDTLSNFLKDSKRFLKVCVIALLSVYIIGSLNIQPLQIFKFKYYNFDLNIMQLIHLSTFYIIRKTYFFIDTIIIIYKNTYSDFIKNTLKQDAKK